MSGRPASPFAPSAHVPLGGLSPEVEPWLPGPWADDPEPRFGCIAVFGGVYSNHIALSRLVVDARERGAEAVLCLGDLGAFGPSPDRTVDIIRDAAVPMVRGNYDDSISRGLEDCQCGYTDPRDNYYARLSYQYTYRRTKPGHRAWMGRLPFHLRFRVGSARAFAFHGSPRRMNEFLWESTTPTHFLEALAGACSADLLLGTHTGIHWRRRLSDDRMYVNVGSLGRPANNGQTQVWYSLLSATREGVRCEFVPLHYDFAALAGEMRDEGLPGEFIETVETGWWTTCLEILPGKERARGRW